MKNCICIFVCILFISCKAQDTSSFDIKRENVIVFNFINKNSRKLITQEILYESNGNEILTVFRADEDMGAGYFRRNFTLVQKKDTMNLVCNYCGKGRNYFYFKNIEFRKGNYELKFEFANKYNELTKTYEKQIKYTLGKEIEVPQEVQNILFKNADYKISRKLEYNDLYFKNLKFIEIDLKDSVNVKLKRLD